MLVSCSRRPSFGHRRLQIGSHRLHEGVQLCKVCDGPHHVHADKGEYERVFPDAAVLVVSQRSLKYVASATEQRQQNCQPGRRVRSTMAPCQNLQLGILRSEARGECPHCEAETDDDGEDDEDDKTSWR
jgi:hypothetical protein